MDLPPLTVEEVVSSTCRTALNDYIVEAITHIHDAEHPQPDLTVKDSGRIDSPCGNFFITFCSLNRTDLVVDILQSLRTFSADQWLQLAVLEFSDKTLTFFDVYTTRVKIAACRLSGTTSDSHSAFPAPTDAVRAVFASMTAHTRVTEFVYDMDALCPYATPQENWEIVKPPAGEQMFNLITGTFCDAYRNPDSFVDYSSAAAIAAPTIKVGEFEFKVYDVRLLMVRSVDLVGGSGTDFRLPPDAFRQLIIRYMDDISDETPAMFLHSSSINGSNTRTYSSDSSSVGTETSQNEHPEQDVESKSSADEEDYEKILMAVRRHMVYLFTLMVRTSPQPGLNDYLAANPVVLLTIN